MHAVRVNEVKLASRNVFIVNLFYLESENKIQHDQKNFLLGLPVKSSPVSKPLASERWQLAFFHTILVLVIFWLLPVAFRKEKRLISLNSALNFTSNKPFFCRLSVLVHCCAGNQYSEITLFFSKFLRDRGHSKG